MQAAPAPAPAPLMSSEDLAFFSSFGELLWQPGPAAGQDVSLSSEEEGISVGADAFWVESGSSSAISDRGPSLTQQIPRNPNFTALAQTSNYLQSHQQQQQHHNAYLHQQSQLVIPSIGLASVIVPSSEPTLKQVTYPLLKKPDSRATPSQIMNMNTSFHSGSLFESSPRPFDLMKRQAPPPPPTTSFQRASPPQPIQTLSLQQGASLAPSATTPHQAFFTPAPFTASSPLFTQPRVTSFCDSPLDSPLSPAQFFSPTLPVSAPGSALFRPLASSQLNPSRFEPLDAVEATFVSLDFSVAVADAQGSGNGDRGLFEECGDEKTVMEEEACNRGNSGASNSHSDELPVDDDGHLKKDRRAYRKQAEKNRRDMMKTCLAEVRHLLPRSSLKTKIISKERVVEKAFEYIVELKVEVDRKSDAIHGLEAEINALKASMGFLY